MSEQVKENESLEESSSQTQPTDVEQADTAIEAEAEQTAEASLEEAAEAEQATAEESGDASDAEPVTEPKREFKPIATKTKIDLDTRAALTRNMILSNWMPFAVLTLVLMTVGAMMWIMLEDDEKSVGITMFVLGFAIPAVLYGGTLLLAKYNASKMPDAKTERVIELVFGDSITGVEVQEGAVDKKIEFAYDTVVRVRQSKRFFFLYMDNRSAIVVDKNGVEGDERELAALLKERCIASNGTV